VNTIKLIQEASEEVSSHGISVEIIDLRTLVPCDWETIEKSLTKTGRLVVVQEDTKTSSFGTSIITEMLTKPSIFSKFSCPPKLITRDDVFIPYHKDLEYAVLPSTQEIITAIHEILS
jgi:2-oxoisovalerate dehydrogenase E1 component